MSCNQSQHIVSILSYIAIGLGVVKFNDARLAWAIKPDIPRIQAGAERGSEREEIELGAAYFVGRGVERDEKRAAYWYEKAANSGDPGAQRQIGYFYQVGIGVERDPARAVQWYERAIAGGLVSAKVNLGVAYVWGTGVRKDDTMAAQLFREAAEKGSGAGACYLGDMHYFGEGFPKDAAEARHWYEIGSRLHDSRAEFNLALILSGEQTRASHERAAKLLRESAKAGFVSARHQLGLFIVRNPDLANSPGEGIALLEQAASEGVWKSSIVLGILARDGNGVPKDAKVAYYRFRVASLQGGAEAVKLLANDVRILSAQLGGAQIERLDGDAAAWFQNHHVALEFVYEHGEDRTQFPAFALKLPERGKHAGLLIASPPMSGKGEAEHTSALESVPD